MILRAFGSGSEITSSEIEPGYGVRTEGLWRVYDKRYRDTGPEIPCKRHPEALWTDCM